MSIFEDIKKDARESLRQRDTDTVTALRSGVAAIQEKCTSQEERTNPPDELAISALRAHCKKLQKAIDMKLPAELRGQYMREKLYLEDFLPEEKTAPGLQEAVQAAVDELEATGNPAMIGRVTGHVMKQGKGFSGAEVSALARELCSQ
tara:strand:- start:2197 stop:2640 length:444 start_codon:yes stop_codon:yes gene_type:complete